ncbi:MAG: T9SS type A sorting domain-containing protein [Flavobacteriales bacterium]|nr:T9SS type A sorting domain-containing protein [Flavobacteriales bacterium]
MRAVAARYAEALTFIQEGNTNAAQAAVAELTDGHMLHEAALAERQRMLDLISFCAGVFGDDRSMAQLTTTEQDQLEALIDGAYDRPATWAQNLLCFAYDRCRTPLTGGDSDRRPSIPYQAAQTEGAYPVLTVMPNPATTWLTMNIRLTSDPDQTFVAIRDVMGRVVWQAALGTQEQQVVWDCRGVEPGPYSVEVISGGASVAAAKLIVQR